MMNKNEKLMDVMLGEENIVFQNIIEKLKRTSDFQSELSFGTGGVRGEVGIGTNKINDLTIAKLALDVANYLIASDKKEQGALIFYDTRYTSKHFARLTTKLLMSKDIHVCVSEKASPTPVLSYAVNTHSYFLGIMITASHNPYTDNGFKVYNEHGNQFTDRDLELISPYLNTSFDQAAEELKFIANKKYAIKKTAIYEKEYEKYLAESFQPMLHTLALSDLKVIYSPLHGAGSTLLPRASKLLPFLNLISVEKQTILDGFFKTLVSPNPESPDSFKQAFEVAKNNEVDTVLLTDPDADRLGAAIKNEDFKIYSGNELGVLFLTFLIETGWKETEGTLLSTVVSSDLPDIIAKSNSLNVTKTLTGFKYIGEYISAGNKDFYFAFEESGGYLFFDQVRDKDGIQAALIFAVMKAYYDHLEISLDEKLEEIYEEHGYFENHLTTSESIEFKELKEQIYERLNENELANVWKIEDYETKQMYTKSKWHSYDEFPKTPLLKVYFAKNDWIAFRPSGTENHFKIYQQSWGETSEMLKQNKKNAQAFLAGLLSTNH